MKIQVASQGWGNVDVMDVTMVLENTAKNYLRSFQDLPPFEIVVKYRDDVPETCPLDAPGKYLIFLGANERYYAQYVYQFSHELCHVTQRCERLKEPGNRWFHESLCEMASLFTVRAVSKSWVTSPPYPHWSSFASNFGAYAQNVLDMEHARLPSGESLNGWFSKNESSLRGNPYLRELNRLVAARLLPRVEASPATWNSVQFIPNSDSNFPDFLREWRDACPSQFNGLIDDVIREFAF